MKQTNDMGLLEILAFKSGCTYLSDLHSGASLPLVRHAVREIEPSRFSLREWNDAVRYITGEEISFSSCEDAARYLLTGGAANMDVGNDG